jgi:hypothetical protein
MTASELIEVLMDAEPDAPVAITIYPRGSYDIESAALEDGQVILEGPNDEAGHDRERKLERIAFLLAMPECEPPRDWDRNGQANYLVGALRQTLRAIRETL